MSNCILLDGDLAIFTQSFGAATVVVRPGALRASGPTTVIGKSVCVAGDEASVSVPGCAYTTPSHPIPGTGTLEIESLAGDQTASKTRSGGTPVMLVGSQFTAKFTIAVKASQQTPTGPVLDPQAQYAGRGSFRTGNTKFQGV
ncbi:MAG: hypothetical protein R3B48_22255 [Kofleriaceae bacterium]